jgi:4-carboxymuconolactone decarboxylase
MTSRATPVTYDDASPEQQELFDEILSSRGDRSTLVGPDGALRGPFNHMVASPVLGRAMAGLGHAVRFEASVDRRLQELAICTVGAHWRSNFEFWAHSRMARQAGIDQSVIDALAEGRAPSFERDDEAAVHALAAQLVADGRVDQDRYDAVRDAVGEQALVDLITTIGYYSLVSLTLNAHRIPLPEGNEPIWPDQA